MMGDLYCAEPVDAMTEEEFREVARSAFIRAGASYNPADMIIERQPGLTGELYIATHPEGPSD